MSATRAAATILVLGLLAFRSASAVYFVEPFPVSNTGIYPYNMTGLVTVDGFTGSGVVVEHPQIFLTAAHVLYDDGRFTWNAAPVFHRRYGGYDAPADSRGIRAAGIWYFASYAGTTARFGGSHRLAFDLDIAVAWGFGPFANGGYAGWYNDGSTPAASSLEKLFTGYPSACRQDYFMYEVGGAGATYDLDPNTDYYWNWRGFSGCGGMSGGPFWIRGNDALWRVAGLYVSSGLASPQAGIRLLGEDSRSLVWEAAAGIAGAKKLRGRPQIVDTRRRRFGARDGRVADRGRAATFALPAFDKMPGDISAMRLQCRIRHARHRDLRVTLIGPGGRQFTVSNQARPKSTGAYRCEDHVKVKRLARRFAGQSVNGRWKLRVKDVRKGKVGQVREISLRIRAGGRFDAL